MFFYLFFLYGMIVYILYIEGSRDRSWWR